MKNGAFFVGWALVICASLIPATQAQAYHSADSNDDWRIDLSELLRIIQFFHSGGYHCAGIDAEADSEDGYVPGPGNQDCVPHDADSGGDGDSNFLIDLSEALRVIQLYNSTGYQASIGTEDNFAPGIGLAPDMDSLLLDFIELDENRDRGLDFDEARAGLPDLGIGNFEQLDRDGDGLLSRFELLAPPAPTGENADTTAPVILLNGDNPVTLACGEAYVDAGATATDDTDGDLTAEIRVGGEVSLASALPGEYAIRYLVRDRACNAGYAIRTVIIEDTEPPVIAFSGVSELTLQCGIDPWRIPQVTATDACDPQAPQITRDYGGLDASVPGVYTITYSAIDQSGNAAIPLLGTVTVVDTRAPRITLNGPKNIVLETGETYTEYGATATDKCGPTDYPVVIDTSELDIQTPGDYRVHYDATDAADNAAPTVYRRVIVVDPSDPLPRLKVITNNCGSLNVTPKPIVGSVYGDDGYYERDAQVVVTAAKTATFVLNDTNVTGNAVNGVLTIVLTGDDVLEVTNSGTCAGSDECAAAPSLNEYSTVNGVFDGATPSEGLAYDTGDYPDRWLKFTPDYDGNYYMSSCSDDFSPLLSVHETCDSVPLEAHLQTCGGGTGTLLTTYLEGGITYYIRIAAEPGAGGTYRIYAENNDYEVDGEGQWEGYAEGEFSSEGEGAASVEGEGHAGPEGEGEGEGEGGGEGTEDPDVLFENPFVPVARKPLSTFSIDVDTGSYSLLRRYLTQLHRLPPADEVRIEELLNYFDYDYPLPVGPHPFSVMTEVADCPWYTGHRLLHIGLQGKRRTEEARGPANLVFLLDVSGSMGGSDRLPLVKQAMRLLLEGYLDEQDRVGIVTYASTAKVVLESTLCTEENKALILEKINALTASGSTNASGGLALAYEQAEANLAEQGANRIILASDGDFNVGITNLDQLVEYITEQAAGGVALTTLGFGIGNLRDDLMEAIADNGNGNYAYIDTLEEARRVLVQEAQATLVTIAKDVKIQVEFNPDFVSHYRLIGYENRRLRDRDFDDDTVDAGELGAGHTVTALYELILNDLPVKSAPGASWLEQHPGNDHKHRTSDVVSIVNLRYKQPDADVSTLLYQFAEDGCLYADQASDDFRFSAAVAAMGMLVRGSRYSGDATYPAVQLWAESGLGEDRFGLREEFVELVELADDLSSK